MRTTRVVSLLATVVLLVGMTSVASADTLNLGATGWNANATFSAVGGNWSLTLDFVNSSGHTTDLNSFAIQLFNAGASESFTVSSASLNGTAFTIASGGGKGYLGSKHWEFFANDKLNNGSTPDCNTTTVKGWLCADSFYGTGTNGYHGSTIHPLQVANNAKAEFMFSGHYSGTSGIQTLDLMASGCLIAGTCKLDGGRNDHNKWAVSTAMSKPPQTSEPASLMLMVSGLSALGWFGRKLRQ